MHLGFNVAMEGWLIIIVIIFTPVLLLQWCLMVNQGGITISVQPTECKAAAAQSWVGLPLSSPDDDGGGGGDDYDDEYIYNTSGSITKNGSVLPHSLNRQQD